MYEIINVKLIKYRVQRTYQATGCTKNLFVLKPLYTIFAVGVSKYKIVISMVSLPVSVSLTGQIYGFCNGPKVWEVVSKTSLDVSKRLWGLKNV